MELIQTRRRLLMMPQGIDTSPKIVEYGVYWNQTFGSKTSNQNWCITEWYQLQSGTPSPLTLIGYIGSDAAGITFQYYYTNGGTNWYYFNAGDKEGTRKIGNSTHVPTDISFSVELRVLNDCYVYVAETGQILFAGKNTIYYGHRNISELS